LTVAIKNIATPRLILETVLRNEAARFCLNILRASKSTFTKHHSVL